MGPAVGNSMNVLLLLAFTFKFSILQQKIMIIFNFSTSVATIGFKHSPVPTKSDLKNREQARKDWPVGDVIIGVRILLNIVGTLSWHPLNLSGQPDR